MNKKQQNIIFWSAIILVVLAGLVLMARPTPEITNMDEATEGQLIGEEERVFDFGTISMADGMVNHSFKVKNTTADTIKIEKLYTSCSCTEASLIAGFDRYGPFGMQGHGIIPRIGKKLRSGEEATVEAVYDPAAHGPAGVGPVDRTVFVETDSGMIELRIKATVTP